MSSNGLLASFKLKFTLMSRKNIHPQATHSRDNSVFESVSSGQESCVKSLVASNSNFVAVEFQLFLNCTI